MRLLEAYLIFAHCKFYEQINAQTLAFLSILIELPASPALNYYILGPFMVQNLNVTPGKLGSRTVLSGV